MPQQIKTCKRKTQDDEFFTMYKDCEIFNLLQDNNRLRDKLKDIRKEKEKNDYNV